MTRYSKENGFSNLLAVLILAALLALLMAPMLFIANFQARQANSSMQSQKAYFEAEGVLLAALKQLEDGKVSNTGGPPSGGAGFLANQGFTAGALPSTGSYADGVTTYVVDDTEITREISTDPVTGKRTIAVTANTNGYKRKLIAEIEQKSVVHGLEYSDRDPWDIAFVLDFSGSMGFDGAPSLYSQLGYYPIDVLKKGVIDFVNSSQFTSKDRVGIVTYAKTAKKHREIDYIYDKPAFENLINGLSWQSGTNVAQGLAYGSELFDSMTPRTDPDELEKTKKVIILFTDGFPGHAVQRGSYNSNYYDCSNSRSNPLSYGCPAEGCKPFVPADNRYGEECSDITIDTANIIKSRGLTVFSVIYLNPFLVSETLNLATFTGTELEFNLPKEMMKSISSNGRYSETIDIENISTIFEDIQHQTVSGLPKIREVVPD